jgi:hypothetical protein
MTPTACGAMGNMSAHDVHETLAILDTVNGAYQTATVDDYDVLSKGTICELSTAITKFYDNTVSGKLLKTVTVAKVSILTSETIHLSPHPNMAGSGLRTTLSILRRYERGGRGNLTD